VLASRHAGLARDAGALAALPTALTSLVGMQVFAGEFAAASALIEEIDTVTEASGGRLAPYAALALRTLQGREAEVEALIEQHLDEIVDRGEGVGLGVIHWARAFLHTCAGRYEQAVAAAELAEEYPATLLYARWVLPELIESAARCGQSLRAAEALRRLSATTRASGTDWALGIEARCRALLNDDDSAEQHYREAIDRLGRTRVQLELARAHLLYGEWLLRMRRNPDAREHLRTAHELYTTMGAEGYAARAARSLPGGRARPRPRASAESGLSAREAQIARLARVGLSNGEIGARLFISPRTVEYHLGKVFVKLGISSRRQLAIVLEGDPEPARA
jgi:DNA-binding CsgD family transcriptional regulator